MLPAVAISPAKAASKVVVLILVAMQAVPLVWAHLDGVRLDLGAELDVPPAQRYAAARRWADVLLPGAAAITFLAGRADGITVYTTPVAIQPGGGHLIQRRDERRRGMLAGLAFAWCTLAALAGTPTYDAASHVIAVCSSLRGEGGSIPLSALPGEGGAFRLGVGTAHHLLDKPDDVRVETITLERMAARIFHDNRILIDMLLSDESAFSDDMKDWAAQVAAPPLNEIPGSLLSTVPIMSDSRLDSLCFPKIGAAAKLAWVPRMPHQPSAPEGACPRRAADLMPSYVWARVERWLYRTLDDLICIRDKGWERSVSVHAHLPW